MTLQPSLRGAAKVPRIRTTFAILAAPAALVRLGAVAARAVPAFALATLAAAPLVAQARSASTPPVPVAQSVWFDAGALHNGEIRAGAEALAVGRFTFGMSVSYLHTPHPRDDGSYFPYGYGGVAYPQYCDPRMLMLCAGPVCAFCYGDAPRYRAWTASLDARYYPAFLSFRNGPSRAMVYVGEHLGYRWSTWDETSYYPCTQVCIAAPAVGLAPRDSVAGPLVYPVYPGTSTIHHTRGGLEPGLDVGIRVLPIGPLFIEVGGRFSLVTVDDQMRRARVGDLESRLVLAGGINW